MSSGIALAGERISGFAVARGTATSNQTTTATSSGTYKVELFCSSITKGTTNFDGELWVDGVFNQSITGHLAANTGSPTYYSCFVILNPGVHTLTLRGFVDAGTGTLNAGTGATGQVPIATFQVTPA